MYKAFIVEDELVVREGLREKVRWEEANFTLCGEAGDGEIALSMIEELRPDLIITDVRMPFMDGLELSRIVRKILPVTKIIVISGYDDFEYAKQAIGVQATDYLLKPVGASDLMEVLHRVTESLDKEATEMRKRLEAAEVHRDSRILMRERFMNDLATGMLGSANAIEYGKQVGLNLVHRFFGTALMSLGFGDTDGIADRYGICRRGEQLVRELTDGMNEVIFFRRNLTDSVIILMGDSREELEIRCSQLCKTLKFEIEKNTPLEVLLAIGPVEDRVHRISASLQSAEKAFRYRYIFGDTSIIDYKDIDRLGQTGPAVESADSQEIIERIRYNGGGDPLNLAEEYLAKLRASAKGPAMFTHGFVALVTGLTELVEELGGDSAQELSNLTDLDRYADIGSDPESQASYLAEIIAGTARYREFCKENKYGDVIHRAKKFIQDSYTTSDLSLVDVADHVSVSPSHFSTIFSQETGQTFIHYLTEVRMDNAKRLLRSTNDRSSDIAYSVGYKDPHYFSFAFKKNVGMTPSEYRKE